MLAGPRHLAAWEPSGGVVEALSRGALRVARGERAPASIRWIADVSSASRGLIKDDDDHHGGPAKRALDAARAGASAVWISTDQLFAGGSYEALSLARAELSRELADRRPTIISDDVVVSEAQLDRAAGAGADAVLLIAKASPDGSLARLVEAARRRSLEPLVEVCSEDEISLALAVGASVVVVGSLDRDTGKLYPERPRSLIEALRGRASSAQDRDRPLAVVAIRGGTTDVAACAPDAALSVDPLGPSPVGAAR